MASSALGLLFLTLCLLLAGTTQAIFAKPDGYNQPLAKNKQWSFYKFEVYNPVNFTSTRPGPNSTDPTSPGSIYTAQGELVTPDNQLIGINQITRTVIGDDYNVPGSVGQRVNRLQVQANYEFGSAAAGYYDDTIVVSIVSERALVNGTDFNDYDAAITGGTGKFNGATGYMTIRNAIFPNGSVIFQTGLLEFNVWVPRNLPMPKRRQPKK